MDIDFDLLERIAKQRRFEARTLEIAKRLFIHGESPKRLSIEYGVNLQRVYAIRKEVLGALRSFAGAIVLVTHDEGAVEALRPERVVLLPDGVEDLWNPDYSDLVALA